MVAPDLEKLEREQKDFIIEQGGREERVESDKWVANEDHVATESQQTKKTQKTRKSQKARQAEQTGKSEQEEPSYRPELDDEMTLDDITAIPREKSREEIIAEAEAAAFAEMGQ